VNRLVVTRWSHLLGYSGVGAIVRADNELFVIKDTRCWTDRDGRPGGELLCYVDLLRKSLGIEQDLRQPPLSRVLRNGVVEGTCIPAQRFPGWMRCPRCGLLYRQPWHRDARSAPDSDAADCLRCRCTGRPRLQQVAWVVAHPAGGLRDLPWHLLTHRDAQSAQACRADNTHVYLRLRRAAGSGLHWQLSCDRCQATAPLELRQPLPELDPQRQPWDWSKSRSAIETRQPAQILEVNDARLYYPRTRGALVIPPESRIRRDGVLALLYSNRGHRDQLAQTRSALGQRALMRRLADEYRCPVTEVEAAWAEIQTGWPLYDQAVTPGGLISKEFQALTEEIADLADGEDFVPRHQTRGWRNLTLIAEGAETCVWAALDQLVAVTRLREVRVFTGFSRIVQNFDDGLSPSDLDGLSDKPKTWLVPPDLDGSLDWLPAIELYGEGIFFTLNEATLQRWGRQPDLKIRTDSLQSRFEHIGMRFPEELPSPLTPRFILLHTLAHLLIRQLETQAGYPAASIRERIYCDDGEQPMAGILVYVSIPDSVGSLGGLAELAEPKRFLRLLASVFEHANWCSLDPVCSEHEGQGPGQLNLAACHACALIPEPSCMFGNVLLDRSFVRGDLQGKIQPFLAFTADTA